ncbi:DUF87 domain-containing protein [Lactococcus muris]|uniref:DUF87 domain-containing protein n=1 Tax=Lactococcus muris TaxID=2941330 RepID=A0ABV4D8S9_9LACT
MKKEKARYSKRKKQKKESKVVSTQNSLGFEELEANGIMVLGNDCYSKTFSLGSANYVTASDVEKRTMFEHYFDAINSLSQTEHFQLSMNFEKVSKEEFLKANQSSLIGGVGDDIRKEINQIIEEKYDNGKNNYKISSYITLATKIGERARAILKLDTTHATMSTELGKIGISLRELNGLERFNLLNRQLRPDAKALKYFPHTPEEVKNWLAPEYMTFKKSASLIDGRIGKTFYIRQFPYELSDRFLKDVCESGVEGNLTIHASPNTFKNSQKRIYNQKTSVGIALLPQQKRASQEGYSQDMVSPELSEAWDDLSEQQKYMKKTGSKIYDSTLILHIHAKTEDELIDSWNKIIDVQEKHGVVFETLTYLQEQGFVSTLPLGVNYLEPIKGFTRGLITPNIAINIPWTSVELQHPKGKYFGINLLSKNIISIDRRGKTLQNSNGWIVGKSGSGKSVTSKFIIASDYLDNPNDEFIIIDPEREYLSLGEKLNAQVVKISPKAKTNINIVELPKHQDVLDDVDNAIALKSDFLSAMFSNLLRDGLTEIQETIVDEVTVETFSRFEAPTLTEWFDVLGDMVERYQKTENIDPMKVMDAGSLHSKLAIYVTGSYDMFAHETNVNLNNRMVIYDVSQLKDKMKKFGYMAVIDQIQNRIIDAKKRGVKVWVYGDELQTVVARTSPPILREKFADMWARLRKYGGTVTGISQNINLILDTPEGEAMFFNSEFFVLLRQGGRAYKTIVERFELTEELYQYLQRDEKGAGLVIAGDTKVPFNNPIAEGTLLYELVNTDANGG